MGGGTSSVVEARTGVAGVDATLTVGTRVSGRACALVAVHVVDARTAVHASTVTVSAKHHNDISIISRPTESLYLSI